MTEVYYKVRQVLQSATGITKCDRLLLQSASGITKCDRLSLQSASGITKCDSYYKVRRNNGMFIIWNHIANIFYEDRECGLHILPKLTYEHIKLTPYSIMNVRLSVQILNSSVNKVLSTYGPPEAAGTAKFCLLMDTFFDITNAKNIDEHRFKRKPSLVPFISPDDPSFPWLRMVFRQYFEDWYNSVQERSNFTPKAR